jgi:hypothetical protein
MGLFFNEDRKTYCGTYKGFRVYGFGCMIGNNWYGDYYITIPRGESKRQMKVKDSVCRSIEALKQYVDSHLTELQQQAGLK